MYKVMKKIIILVRKIAKLFGIIIIKDRPANSPEKQLSAVLNFLDIDVVFDIGANEGQFGKNIRDIGYKSKIISFEPLTSARKKLIKNANKDSNWVVHSQCAIGNKNGNVKINISKNLVSSSILSINKKHLDAEKESFFINKEIVPIYKLDEIANFYIKSNSNLFIKIDTQGYEKEILNGALKTLKKTKGVLCELSLVSLYKGQFLWRDIVDMLDDKGFALWALQTGFTNPNTGQTLQVDGIFIKKTELKKIKI
jgi:FkbM family methyltransferase